MKKTLLLFFVLLFSAATFAVRYELPLANLGSSGWGDAIVDGSGSVTYITAWTGCGWWLAPGDPNVPTDLSAYNKLVVNFEALPFPMRIVIQYADAADSQVDLDAGVTTGALALDATGASKVTQVYLQSGNGGVGTIVVKEAYFTDGEDEEVTTTYELSLADLPSGYESSYDPATHTITFEGAWKGRGWWFGNNPGRDFSEYDKVVVEFEPVEFAVQIVIEYNGADATSVAVESGATSVEALLDEAGKVNVMQIYLQSSAAGDLTLTAAYLAKVTGIIAPSVNISQVRNVPGGILINANNERVSIYGVDGRLVKQTIASSNTISLAQGLYIVKVGAAKAVKVFVK
jgi:hypothetical protein